jgi:hypothetical protein
MTFQKGQVANPRGRHTHRRNKLTDRFIKELDSDFRAHGADAIAKCRADHPDAYLAIVSRLVPKQTDINLNLGLSERFISAIRNAALPTTSSPTTIIDMTAQPVDDAKPLIPHDTQRNKDTP